MSVRRSTGSRDRGFQDLMVRVRAGDEEAAAELVRTYEPAIMRVIRVRLLDQRLRRVIGDSDIFQSVMRSFFVRAALGQYDLQRADDLLGLLAVMARNKIADASRRRDVTRDRGALPIDDVPEAALA